MPDEKTAQALELLKKVWVLFLVALYMCGFYTELHFPGVREKPLVQEKVLMDAQKVLFFGLMVVGFLVDMVQMREDRNKAFIFLFLSLFLGGLAGVIGGLQFQAMAAVFGVSPLPVSGPGT